MGNDSNGEHSSSTMRMDAAIELKHVKGEPLEVKTQIKRKFAYSSSSLLMEEEEVEEGRVSAPRMSQMERLDVKKQRRSKVAYSLSSLRIDDGAKMKRVKEEALEAARPRATLKQEVATSRKTVVNLTMVEREEEPVAETLKTFEALATHFQFLAREERRTKGRQNAIMRTASVMNANQLDLPGDIIGKIEGIDVGRRFSTRVQMSVTGLHRELFAGINVVAMRDSPGGLETKIATSVVFALGDRYPDNKIGLGRNGICIYSGEGGLPWRRERGLDGQLKYRDQSLTGRNRALFNSFTRNIPIRVIRGLQKGRDNMDHGKYVYDGLYQIVDCRYKVGERRNKVFIFALSPLR
ncbi:hypothetical protein R1flu_001322 [Riccia fluitans]|uniref:YDG domain-containing protein n=1 Tax=Riccia fluitans TaxID=41844 RepID=A0ABD1Y2Z6_9MARC